MGDPSYAWTLKIYNGMESRTDKSNRYPLLPVREITSQGHITNLPKTGQTINYTAWDDGSIQSGVEWPAQRFTDNGDGTITDNMTGLIWLKDGGCLKTKWKTAANILADLNNHEGQNTCDGYTGNYADWRIPNVKELESLINYGSADSAQWLNSQGFVHMKVFSYWSSTTYLRDEMKAWTVNLKKAKRASIRKSSQCFALPVRGGNIPGK